MHHTVEVDNLSFSYPDGHDALYNVSFGIDPNHKVALVGPNGAGKSTLMLHLNGILRGSEGRVCVGGLDMSDDTVGQIRAWVGVVFQHPDDQLFSPRVFDDVAFGPLHMNLPEAEVRERVADALAAVQMSAYVDRVSHHLSLGEKKRIAIATVLSMDPKILVLDEPSAGLDPRARRGLIELLASLDKTMLVATHDMALVRQLLPRTIVMDCGRVVGDGPTDKLLADEDFLHTHGLERPGV